MEDENRKFTEDASLRLKAATLSEADAMKLIHQYEVHRLELEMQNRELQQAKKEAENATKKFSALYDFAPSAYFTIDPKCNICELNHCGARLLGTERYDLVNSDFRQFITRDTLPVFNDFLRRLLASGSRQTCELKFSVLAKSYIFAKVDGVISEDEQYCLLTAVDITRQKQTEEQLKNAKEKAEENDQLKTAFLHNISHEIRTPLNSIIGFSGLILDPRLLPDKRRELSDIIVQSSDQLLSVITDIISISTIEAGQEKISATPVNLNLKCRKLFKQFETKAKNQSISLKFKTALPDNEATILTDRDKLIRVLTILVDNALKFTLQGHVFFGYRLMGNFIEFFIEDTGIGIAADMHQEVFKNFRQVDSSTTRKYGGAGLGLSICKAYIEILGGNIYLTSEPGKGSVFNFTVPYNKPGLHNLHEKMANRVIKNEKPKTLLVAEDEDFNFRFIKEILSGLNYTIIREINGINAVESCRTNPDIDLVLMDLKMPVMDGYEAAKQIKQIRPDLPIIAQTAYSSEGDKNKAFDSGCSDFITKPFRKELLISKIRGLLYK